MTTVQELIKKFEDLEFLIGQIKSKKGDVKLQKMLDEPHDKLVSTLDDLHDELDTADMALDGII